MGQVPVARWAAVPAATAAAFGAGALVTCGPAAAAAGWWSLAGLALAGLVALLTALSLADLVAHSCLTGVSAHVRTRLGVLPGRLAGVLDIGGRVVAAAAVAGAAGRYLWPAEPKIAAVGALVAVGAVGVGGVELSGPSRWVVVAVTIITVAAFVVVGLSIAPVETATAAAGTPGADDPTGILTAAGVFSVGFLVGGPAAPRARLGLITVGAIAVGYAFVDFTALRQLGGPRLALSPTPLRDLLFAADGGSVDLFLTVGLVVAALVGVRTFLSAAADGITDFAEAGELPAAAATHRHLITAIAAAAVTLMTDPATAVTVAATLLLGATAFLNSAARTLTRAQRSTWLPTGCCGLVLSVVVGANISTGSLVIAVVVMAVGAGLCTVRVRRLRQGAGG